LKSGAAPIGVSTLPAGRRPLPRLTGERPVEQTSRCYRRRLVNALLIEFAVDNVNEEV